MAENNSSANCVIYKSVCVRDEDDFCRQQLELWNIVGFDIVIIVETSK